VFAVSGLAIIPPETSSFIDWKIITKKSLSIWVCKPKWSGRKTAAEKGLGQDGRVYEGLKKIVP
jgi:hypothetical protein